MKNVKGIKGRKEPTMTASPSIRVASRGRKRNKPRLSSIPLKRDIQVGPVDTKKERVAKKALMAGGMNQGMDRTAGMMLDGISSTYSNYAPGFVLESYRNSYASGLGYKSGVYDIPTFITLMNAKNGGIIQWPTCLQERYNWFRWYARSDGIVGRALDLLADLPLSKISLHIPKYVPDGMRGEIKDFFEDQVKKLELFKRCGEILYERNCLGNAFVWAEWDDVGNRWNRLQLLPPEEVFVFEIPFSDDKRIEYRPRRLVQMLLGNVSSSNFNGLDEEIVDKIPKDLKDNMVNDGCIRLDSNPLNGSFCEHISRRKSPYMDLSSSLLDRILVPLQLKDFYKFTQLALASRNMSPKYMVIAPECTPSELDDLRAQWDMSYLDPDFSIVANYDFRVDKVDSRDRLLDIASEVDRLDNEIYSAMGVTKELLTGEGSYSNSKISVEILHTMFLRERETLIDFIENRLFVPICEKRGWYEEDKNGVKKYWCPTVGFNRLTIRDNQEVFDSLFQLYQKGSLPVEVIYELFNLDTTEIDKKMYQDLFTIRDPSFNELVRDLLSGAGRALGEGSDITAKLAKYLKLELTKSQEDGGGQVEGQTEGDVGSLEELVGTALDDSPSAEQTGGEEDSTVATEEGSEAQVKVDHSRVDEIVNELPSDATAEEIIEKIISKQKTWDGLTEYERNLVIDDVISELGDKATPDEILSKIILKTRGI